jgi:integrase/recombinase XerD
MLYASGMRVTELVSLDVDDVNLASGSVRVRGKKASSKERIIPVGDRALEALRTYVNKGRMQLMRDPDERALFLNHRGQRLTRQGLWLIIKHYVDEVGISEDVTPHTLRHSFAAHKLSQGKSLQDIQKLLGHANISTTQVYQHVGQETET